MKYKLKFSEYDKETKISMVGISTDLGYFIGTSKLHEEDYDIESAFQGCMYAEIRAVIKYTKAKIKNLKEEIYTLENLFNNLKQLRCYDENDKSMRFINKTIERKKKQLDILQQQLEMINIGLDKQMENYRKEHEDFMKKIKKDTEPTE